MPKVKDVSDDTIIEICNLLANTSLSRKEIADMTGVTPEFVHRVRAKRVRPDITDQYTFDGSIRRGRKISNDDIDDILNDLNNGESTRSIANKYGVSKTIIQRIKQGAIYKNCGSGNVTVNSDIFDDPDTVCYRSKGRDTNIVVTPKGKIYSSKTRKEITSHMKTGSVQVLCDDGTTFSKSVDRIMGEVFLNLQSDQAIEHIDHDKTNYSVNNLKVIPMSEKLRKSHNLIVKIGGS